MKPRILFFFLSLILSGAVSAQSYHFQYSHDTLGNRTSRTYQGARHGSAPSIDTAKIVLSDVASVEASDDERLPSYKYTEKDTVKVSPFIKTQAEKDAYQDSMMAEVMKLQPLPVGRDIRDMTDYSVGAIPLEYGVSGSGARTYSVPILTAPDIKYAPSLSLAYNSQGGYGCIGYGWDIAGLSSITITNKTTYWDGEIEAADSSDRDGVFCLDGIRLVPNDDPATSASYPLVTATGHILVSPQRNIRGYITTFTALYPEGTTAVYGIQNIDNQFTFPVYPVTRTTNIIGEKIEYSYTFIGGWNNNACPVLSSARYGFNASGVATAEIRLSYSTPTSDVTSYVAGRSMSRKPLVASITSISGDTTLYTYVFSRISPAAADAVLLKSITLKNADWETLPPLTFTYGYDNNPPTGNGHLQQSDSIQLVRGFVSNPIYRRGKFVKGIYDDGLVGYAGLSTYTKLSGFTHRYACNYPADSVLLFLPSLTDPDVSFGISAQSGFLTAEAVDVDGDGVDEMVKVRHLSTNNDGSLVEIKVYRYDPQANLYATTSFQVRLKGRIHYGLYYSPYLRTFRWGDFRGDGTTQMLAVCYSDNGDGVGQSSWTTLVDLTTGDILDERGTSPVASNQDRRIICTDLDGDGCTELYIAASDRIYVYRYENGEPEEDDSINVIHADIVDTDRSYFADVNADGYIDIIQASHYDDRWYFHYNTGIGFAPTITMHICTYQADDRFMFMDIDRDGYPDLVQLRDSDIVYYRNDNGSSFGYYSTSPTPIPEHSVILPPNVVEHSAMSSFVTVYGKYVRIYDYTSYVPPLRHLVQSCDSFGKIVRNTYGYLPKSSTYWTGNTTVSADDGYQLRVLPIYVLTGAKGWMSESSGAQVFLQDSYAWFDPVVHTRGLGFCGFAKTRRSWSLDGVSRVAVSRFDPQRRAIPVSSSIHPLSESHPAFSVSSFSYDSHATTYGKLQPRLIRSEVTKSVDGILSTTDYTYDVFDYPIKVETLRQCTVNGVTLIAKDVVETVYIHSNNPSKYILGGISSQTSFHDRDGDGILKMGQREVYTLDNLLRPMEHLSYRLERSYNSSQPQAHLVSTERWQYDSHGNVTRQESAPSGSLVFTGSSYAYDASGRHLVSSTNPLGLTTTYSGFDIYGSPSVMTNHKGQQTHSFRDGWGRVTRTVHPDGTVDSLIRTWGGSGVYTETSTSTGAPDVVVDYDAAGREVLSRNKRFDGQWQKVKTIYDQRGNKVLVSIPYRGGSPLYWNNYQYDAYGRATRIIEPSGRRTTWSYNGTTVTERKDGIRTIRTTNPAGLLVSVADSLNTITYTYRDDGQPASVTTATGATTTFAYDTLGRRTSITDPSAGTRSTAYVTNSDGSSSVTETNALGSVVTVYDRFGRKTSVQRPDFNSTYSYDTLGRLISAVSTNGTSSHYTYDAYDRPLTAKDSVPDGKWLQKVYTYNANGKVATIAYTSQGGYITTEMYTYANGHNYKITMPDGTVIYQLNAENDLGQPTAATSAGVSRTYGYTAYGLPTYRKMDGGALMDHSYTFDATTGNLLSRSRTYGGNTTTENFSYDNLGRLTSAAGNNVTYDTNNNVTSIGGVGTMDYGSDAHPYQITDFCANSTLWTDTAHQTVTYTAYDRPATIVQGDKSAVFTYDAGHDRVKTQIERWGERIDRYYIGGRYEINDDEMDECSEWLYLGGDAYSAPMILYKGYSWAQWQPYIIGRDYLGSVNVLATGGVLQSGGNFDAWGRGYASFYINRGWGGHEHLDDFGLINMNARLYDPVLGRFLSPDPYVQAPDFPGNFNRYAYGLNNSLKYVDPKGEILLSTLAVAAIIGSAALIGGTVNVLCNLNSIDSFSEGLTTALSGAIGGALTATVGIFSGGLSYIALAGAGAGALTSFNNSIVAQTGKNFLGIKNIDWGVVGKMTLSGAAAGAASAATGTVFSSLSSSLNGAIPINSPLLKSLIASPASSAVGHWVGGTTYGILSGKTIEAAASDAWKGVGKSVLMGTAIGLSATLGNCLYQGVNPFTGKQAWTPNHGFAGESQSEILEEGTIIDRYGEETGNYAAQPGTTINERGLPRIYSHSKLHTYRVAMPIKVESGTSAGSFWLGVDGGGIQYYFENNIQYYIDNGYLIPIAL